MAEEARAACSLEVRGVVATAGERFVILLAEPGATELRARLLAVTASGRARLHLAPPRRGRSGEFGEAAVAADSFARALGTRIGGSVLESIAIVVGERIVELKFRGTRGETRLIAELFGADPNLIVVDETGVVRGARRTRGGARPIAVGSHYGAPSCRPPAPRTEADPSPIVPPPTDPTLAEFATRHPVSFAFSLAYEPLDLAAIAAEWASALSNRLRTELARNARLVADLERDLAAADEAPRRRELADLLAANFGKVRKGQSSLTVEDLYRGGEVAIPLDPALAPKDNLAKAYRGVERLERGRPQVAARLAAAKERATNVARALELATRAHESELARAAAAAAAAQVFGETRPRGERQGTRDSRAVAEKEPFLRFALRSGAEILVGRDDAGNDHLTHRVARSHDVWLHVHGFHGSHVVLRVERNKSASLTDLLAAGQLAVHFSKRRGAARADVSYTEKKYVRKGRGKAGLAILERHKTLTIDHDAKQLAELLGKDCG